MTFEMLKRELNLREQGLRVSSMYHGVAVIELVKIEKQGELGGNKSNENRFPYNTHAVFQKQVKDLHDLYISYDTCLHRGRGKKGNVLHLRSL
jgi:hypothetical protein